MTNIRVENMDKYYSEVKRFFSNVQIEGTLFERAKTVCEFLEFSKTKKFFAIAGTMMGSFLTIEN